MMRAAVFDGIGKPLHIAEVDDPTPAADEVIVKVCRCGICGSDLHMTEEPSFGLCQGDILGHEFAGEVVATGREVCGLPTGQLVSVVPFRSCGHCAACLQGDPAWCAQMSLVGGGYGEYAKVHARQCVVLPGDSSVTDGALVEPLAVALHGLSRSGLQPGQSVLILGAGPIGLAVAFWAARHGARHIVVHDIHQHQQERAMQMGATHFVCDREMPVASAQKALGGSADIVFECAGAPGLIAQSIALLKTHGTLVILGLCTRPDSFVPFAALSKELNILTSAFFNRREYEAALDVLAKGALEPRLLISSETNLDTLPTVFESLRQHGKQCKVMINHE